MKGIGSKTVLLASLVMALLCVAATADISIQPGDGVNYTHQTWYFGTAPINYNNILADVDDNPFGQPVAQVTESGSADTLVEWRAAGPGTGHTGVLYASPQMNIALTIPNTINEGLTKIVEVELEYFTRNTLNGGFAGARIMGVPGGAWIGPEQPGVPVKTLFVADAVYGDGWWYDLTLLFEIPQIYTSDLIEISLLDSGVWLDSVEVATVCVPVPGAVLLGFFGLSYAGMKLRRFV
jgi:hypothetical protein